MAKFHQKMLSGYLKIGKIRQGITFLSHPVYQCCRPQLAKKWEQIARHCVWGCLNLIYDISKNVYV